MRSPNYIRDHPKAGKGGIQRLYRFPNNYGAQVDWLFAQGGGWNVTPVEFFDMEITSYLPCGSEQKSMNPKQVDAFLDEIEAKAQLKIYPENAPPYHGNAPVKFSGHIPNTGDSPLLDTQGNPFKTEKPKPVSDVTLDSEGNPFKTSKSTPPKLPISASAIPSGFIADDDD